MSDWERATRRVNAYLLCVELVREAVAAQRAQLAAVRMAPEERAAHPESWHPQALNLEDWYRRAGEANDMLEATE